MSLELGVYSFGNTPRSSDGSYGPTAQAIRNVLEAVKLAEDVGLDFFGFGEHHTRSMPLSSPTSLVTAAAASTERIKLGTTVTVLSTDEPLRVFQQLATAAAIAPGRIETVAGRGSSAITFPLFDYDERDYDMLYASELELLLAANASEQLTWSGPHRRRPLQDALIVPRPEQPLKIWLGSRGTGACRRRPAWPRRSGSGLRLPPSGRSTRRPSRPRLGTRRSRVRTRRGPLRRSCRSRTCRRRRIRRPTLPRTGSRSTVEVVLDSA
jgi:hypothetical protein